MSLQELNEKDLKLIYKKMVEELKFLLFAREHEIYRCNLKDFFSRYKFSVDFIDNFLKKNKKTIDGLNYGQREEWRNCMSNIIIHQDLSEEFMEKNKDVLAWQLILMHQNTSDDFLEKHIDSFSFLTDNPYRNVFRNGKFSYNFAVKHINKMDKEEVINCLKENTRINQKEFEPLYVALCFF